MEPARDERGDPVTAGDWSAGNPMPQWSPLAMSGATRRRTRYVPPGAGPAMEPARDERGDRHAGQRPPSGVDPALEPARDERGDGDLLAGGRVLGGPQWSPLAMSGATTSTRSTTSGRPVPQWSPLAMSGATSSVGGCARCSRRPQWSPLAMSGATRDGPVRAVVGPPAAMEPARDERGDRVTLSQPLDVTVRPQWSPLAMSGATPNRSSSSPPTSKPQWSPLAMSGATWHMAGVASRYGEAAMEPARDERGDSPMPRPSNGAPRPQWSPLAMSGATGGCPDARRSSSCRNGARSR